MDLLAYPNLYSLHKPRRYLFLWSGNLLINRPTTSTREMFSRYCSYILRLGVNVSHEFLGLHSLREDSLYTDGLASLPLCHSKCLDTFTLTTAWRTHHKYLEQKKKTTVAVAPDLCCIFEIH